MSKSMESGRNVTPSTSRLYSIIDHRSSSASIAPIRLSSRLAQILSPLTFKPDYQNARIALSRHDLELSREQCT